MRYRMTRYWIGRFLLVGTLQAAAAPASLDDLLQDVLKEREVQTEENKARERRFLESREQQREILAAARATLATEQACSDALRAEYGKNEAAIELQSEALDSAELSSEANAIIHIVEPLGAYSEQSGVSVMVSGFTDDQPLLGITSPFQDNWELSTERALTVMRALVAAGFPVGKVFAAGFGEYKPVAPNVSDKNRARNRRVEITPVPTLESIPPP
jgi:flagellar motor protein MotB